MHTLADRCQGAAREVRRRRRRGLPVDRHAARRTATPLPRRHPRRVEAGHRRLRLRRTARHRVPVEEDLGRPSGRPDRTPQHRTPQRRASCGHHRHAGPVVIRQLPCRNPPHLRSVRVIDRVVLPDHLSVLSHSVIGGIVEPGRWIQSAGTSSALRRTGQRKRG